MPWKMFNIYSFNAPTVPTYGPRFLQNPVSLGSQGITPKNGIGSYQNPEASHFLATYSELLLKELFISFGGRETKGNSTTNHPPKRVRLKELSAALESNCKLTSRRSLSPQETAEYVIFGASPHSSKPPYNLLLVGKPPTRKNKA